MGHGVPYALFIRMSRNFPGTVRGSCGGILSEVVTGGATAEHGYSAASGYRSTIIAARQRLRLL
jgi:hypothetical protein